MTEQTIEPQSQQQGLPGEIQVIVNAITAQRDQALAMNVNMHVAQYHADQRIKELEAQVGAKDAEIDELKKQISVDLVSEKDAA